MEKLYKAAAEYKGNTKSNKFQGSNGIHSGVLKEFKSQTVELRCVTFHFNCIYMSLYILSLQMPDQDIRKKNNTLLQREVLPHKPLLETGSLEILEIQFIQRPSLPNDTSEIKTVVLMQIKRQKVLLRYKIQNTK